MRRSPLDLYTEFYPLRVELLSGDSRSPAAVRQTAIRQRSVATIGVLSMKPLSVLLLVVALCVSADLPSVAAEEDPNYTPLVQRQRPRRLGERQLCSGHLFRQRRRDHHDWLARPATCAPPGNTKTSSSNSTGCTSTRRKSATPACSFGAIRCRPSAPATRAASRSRCSSISTWKDKKTGALTATSQGDLFSIWGAKCTPDRPHPLGWERCLPSSNHTKGGGEWNHYKVVANDGVIKLTVNGTEVSGVSKCSPRKGYLALESEGAECHFKNLKIKELPSTNPTPAETADIDQGSQIALRRADAGRLDFLDATGKLLGQAVEDVRWPIDCRRQGLSCRRRRNWPVRADFRLEAAGPVATSTNASYRSAARCERFMPPRARSRDGWHRETIKVEKVAGPAPIRFAPAAGLEIMNLFVRELPAK